MNQSCPRCGGSDRFYLISNPRKGTAPFWLCRRCNHSQPATDADTTGTRTPLRTLSPDEIDQAHMGYTAVARWCAAYLWSSNSESIKALNYLRQRGFSDETIKAAQLGYHPAPHGYAKTGCKALDWGVSSEITHEESHAAQLGGLLGPQGRPKSVLRGTITIPYWYGGRCTLLRGRQLITSPEKKLRYLSPGGVPLYAGSAPTLYMADEIAAASTILLCEGEFKALAARQAGIVAVAQPGIGYLPDRFVQSLAGKTVVVAYDVEERSDPFELSPGERFTLVVVARLCGISQQQQIEHLYKALAELDKAKGSDDIREQTIAMAQIEAARLQIEQLKNQLAQLKQLKLRVKVLRLPRRADQHKVDLDSFLLRHDGSVLVDLVAHAPEGSDWHTAHSGGEFAFTRTGMTNGKPVANYKARIMETVYQHDGLVTTTLQRLALQTPSGVRRIVDITGDEWADDRQAVKSIRKGLQEGTFDDTPMQALRAVRLLSNQGDAPVSRRVNTCTGWEQIEGKWHFLAPDGAIHAGGINPTLRAEIDAATVGNHYAMCGPGDARAGFEAWYAYLCGSVCPQPLALMLAGQTALSVLHRFNGNEARAMVWLHHETGSMKTAVIRAGCMALFGPRFTAERGDGAPVIKWNSTANALSAASFFYRDLPLIIDDYKAGMISPEHLKRYLHDYSEGASRARSNVHLGLDKARPVRVIAFSTAEDIPQGDPGMQARLLSLVLKPEMVNPDALSALQRAGVQGHLAAFFRSFIQRMAHELDTFGVGIVEERMQALVRADDAALDGHRRTAGSLRQNRAAWLMLAAWLVESGYLTKEQAQQLNAAHISARMLLTADLSNRQRESRPSQIFLTVLTEMLSNGDLLIESPDMTCSRCKNDMRRAVDGWFCLSPTCTYHIPATRIIGFRYGPNAIGISSNRAFREVCRVRNDQRQPFNYSQAAIWQQLEADGALVARGTREPQIRIRNPAVRGPDGKGKPEFVLLIRVNLLETQIDTDLGEIGTDPTDPTDPERFTASGRAGTNYEKLIPGGFSTDPTDPSADYEAREDSGISGISSGSVATDPKLAASECGETRLGSVDQLKNDPYQIFVSRPRDKNHQEWLTYTRSLLRQRGTVKELSLNVAGMTTAQMETLCAKLERRKTKESE